MTQIEKIEATTAEIRKSISSLPEGDKRRRKAELALKIIEAATEFAAKIQADAPKEGIAEATAELLENIDTARLTPFPPGGLVSNDISETAHIISRDEHFQKQQ